MSNPEWALNKGFEIAAQRDRDNWYQDQLVAAIASALDAAYRRGKAEGAREAFTRVYSNADGVGWTDGFDGPREWITANFPRRFWHEMERVALRSAVPAPAAPTPEDATKEETCEGCKYAHGRKVPVSSSYPCESCRRFPTAEILDYYTQEKPVPATVKGESQ